MPSFNTFLSLILTWLLTVSMLAGGVNAFTGDLKVYNLFVSSPFQANATSTYNSTIIFRVVDEDDPSLQPVDCEITWKAGTSPPDHTLHQCSNDTMRAWLPDGTFHGVGNLQIDFAHTIMDPSVGECPLYCYLTKYASLNLTSPETSGYNCDLNNATCETTLYHALTAVVYSAIA